MGVAKHKYVYVIILYDYDRADIHSIWENKESADIVMQYESILKKDNSLEIERWKINVPKKGLQVTEKLK